MELYLLKSAACLALFFVFYKVFLEKTSLHVFKRFYLLLGLVASFLIPTITFTVFVEPLKINEAITTFTAAAPSEIVAHEEVAINYTALFWWAYAIGATLFGIRFLLNLFKISEKIHQNPKEKQDKITNVLIPQSIAPHTFFNFIFFNKKCYEAGEIPYEVILHEQTHARQKHSIDILCIEIIHVLFWFNPIVYFLKKSIKLNHEFLADHYVLQQGINRSGYQNILLAFSSNATSPQLANSIHYSSIKKRFTVMKTQTSKTNAWLKRVLVLPLLAVLIYGFSTTESIPRTPSNLEVSPKAKTATHTNYAHEFLEGAQRNEIKTFVLQIENSKIRLNGKPVALNKLTKSIDAVTKDWEETDYTSAKPQVLVAATPQSFLNKVDIEFRKTHFSKANGGYSIIPPPPPAPATLSKLKKSQAPPPPPPPSSTLGNVTKKYKNSLVFYVNRTDIYVHGKKTPLNSLANALDAHTKNWKDEDFKLFGLSLQIDKVEKDYVDKINAEYRKSRMARMSSLKKPYLIGPNDLPPPPPPPNTLDYVIDMAKKNTSFFYEGSKISSDRAIDLVKNNKFLNISTNETKDGGTVKITKNKERALNTNQIKKEGCIGLKKLKKLKADKQITGCVTINKTPHYYSKIGNTISLYNKWGNAVNEKGEKL